MLTATQRTDSGHLMRLREFLTASSGGVPSIPCMLELPVHCGYHSPLWSVLLTRKTKTNKNKHHLLSLNLQDQCHVFSSIFTRPSDLITTTWTSVSSSRGSQMGPTHLSQDGHPQSHEIRQVGDTALMSSTFQGLCKK